MIPRPRGDRGEPAPPARLSAGTASSAACVLGVLYCATWRTRRCFPDKEGYSSSSSGDSALGIATNHDEVREGDVVLVHRRDELRWLDKSFRTRQGQAHPLGADAFRSARCAGGPTSGASRVRACATRTREGGTSRSPDGFFVAIWHHAQTPRSFRGNPRHGENGYLIV